MNSPQNPDELPELHFQNPSDEQEVQGIGPGMLAGTGEPGHDQGFQVDPRLRYVVPEDLMHRYQIVPLQLVDDRLVLGMRDVTDVIAIDDVRLITGYDVEPVAMEPDAVASALNGCHRPLDAIEPDSIFPLQELEMAARISGPIASVQVRQTFANVFDKPIEAIYLFPLPDGAAVSEFRMLVGGRTVEGEVQEKARARSTYEEGVKSGFRSALLEASSGNVFEVRVGNLPSGQEVTIEFRYAHYLEMKECESTFRFPLVVAPRYVPDGRAVSMTPARIKTAARLSLLVEVETAGLRPDYLRCSQHDVTMSASAGGDLRLELTDRDELLDRDFILSIGLGSQQPQGLLLAAEDHFLLQMVPPLNCSHSPRDVVFLVDRSGSMGGLKMKSARDAVKSFMRSSSLGDRFALLAFDTALTAFSEGALTYDVESACEWVSALQARGGTEMLRAFKELGRYSSESGRLLCCVLITDGQVSNESQILNLVSELSEQMRMFTLGIDSAVNGAFLRQVARIGRGTCELVVPGEALENSLRRLQRETRSVAVTDIRLVDRGLNMITRSQAPERIPDLFGARSVVVAGRRIGVGGGEVEVVGTQPEGGEWRCRLSPQICSNPALPLLWARQRVRCLEDQLFYASSEQRADIEKEILSLALEYGLLSKYTSFVLVDRAEVVNQEPLQWGIVQPLQLPANWEGGTMKDIACQDFGSLDTDSGFDDEIELDRLKELVDEAPIVRVVDLILSQAWLDRATHIHIEAEERSSRVRYRVDGVLHDVMSPPKHIHSAMIGRLKAIAGLKLQSAVPDRAVFEVEFDGQPRNLILTTCPTRHGEKVLIEVQQHPLSWGELGSVKGAVEAALDRPGMVLVVGAARSGVSETLAACAKRLAMGARHVVLWDESSGCPEGVSQPPTELDLDDRELLGRLAKQDLDALVTRCPNWLLPELTCATSSLGLSVVGLCASDAVEGVRRLAAVPGAKDNLSLVLAQARLRRLCISCEGSGCDSCRMTGYKGQLTLFECLPVTPKVWSALRCGVDLRTHCQGSIKIQAATAVARGLTNEAELKRVGLDSHLCT